MSSRSASSASSSSTSSIRSCGREFFEFSGFLFSSSFSLAYSFPLPLFIVVPVVPPSSASYQGLAWWGRCLLLVHCLMHLLHNKISWTREKVKRRNRREVVQVVQDEHFLSLWMANPIESERLVQNQPNSIVGLQKTVRKVFNLRKTRASYMSS